MNTIAHILGRIAIADAEYDQTGQWRMEVLIRRTNGTIETGNWERIKDMVLILIVRGQKVITKPDDSQLSARIKADGDTFLWSSTAGQTSFIRKEHLQEILQVLTSKRIVPVMICCANSTIDLTEVVASYSKRFQDSLNFKILLQTTCESSAITQAIVRRVAPIILILTMLLLAGNLFFTSHLNSYHQQLQAAIQTHEQIASKSAVIDAGQQKLQSDFETESRINKAIVCDRIAHAVPTLVLLSKIEIEPLEKRLAAGEPLLRKKHTATIYGRSPSSAEISLFVQKLSNLTCCREVQLRQVERGQNTHDLNFFIELKL